MNEKERMAVEETKKVLMKYTLGINPVLDIEVVDTLLSIIQNQELEIKRLKNNNKNLLRKLRNRVKEVKKLTKYSSYKKEFSTLNKQLQKKDKMINEMAPRVYLNKEEREEMKEYIWKSNKPKDFSSFVKQYFERKVEE